MRAFMHVGYQNRMHTMFAKKIGIGTLLVLCISSAFAQIGLKPLQSNPSIQTYLNEHPGYVWNSPTKLGKWGSPDTLNLPFFEDFTSTLIYPDSSKWQDNLVFVNRDFAINPPSFGVATFDFLDENGKPYSSIEKEFIDNGDTLTSQFINLGDSSGVPFVAADSIFLSFFYQPKGRGDFITENDSLKLLFLDESGQWNKVWGVKGGLDYNFKQVLVPITDSRYLHTGFQFRFMNITHRWGNNNHWHVDYIYLNKDRGINDIYYPDYAIQSKPTSLLKNFNSMPYDHFMADVSEAADSIYFNVSNLNDKVINAEVRHVESHLSNILVTTIFDNNAANVPSQGFAKRKMKSYDFKGLSGEYPLVINRNYLLRESGIINPVLFQGNDNISVDQTFTRHYAYDDGTAESGFGFNDLKTLHPTLADQWHLTKNGDLKPSAVTPRRRFVFQIWRDIDFNGGTDDLAFEKTFIVEEIYNSTDNRGFYTIGLDTAIPLAKGKFYVGWSQEQEYNLTLGFDKNNGNISNADQMNEHIYFNIGDGWIKNENRALVGAPMIRPIVGDKDPFLVSVNSPRTERFFNIYPNPARTEIHLPGDTKTVSIVDMNGREIVKRENITSLNISDLESGIYSVVILTKQNERLSAKLVKL